jgi:hypothetical protein
VALSYYRYERIIQNIAVKCEQIFSFSVDCENRQQAFKWMKSNFLPGSVIENARTTDETMRLTNTV